MINAQRRWAVADAIRALAIFLVFLCHVGSIHGFRLHGVAHSFSYLGIWGINCFFVLSGFLLSGNFLGAALEINKFPNTRLFLFRRALRIIPLYFASIIVCSLLLIPLGRPLPSLIDVLIHLFFLQNMSSIFEGTINSPLWTMPVDVDFYVLLPIFAWFGCRTLRGSRLQRIRGMFTVLFGTCILSLVYRSIAVAGFHVGTDTYGTMIVRNVFGMWTAFALGAILALITLTQPSGRPSRGIGAICLLVSAMCFLLLARIDGTGAGPHAFLNIFTDPVAAISVAFLLYGLEVPVRQVDQVVRSPVISGAASLAYAVYLFHYPVIELVHRLFATRVSLLGTFLVLVVSFVATLSIAIPGHILIERPLLRLKNRSRESDSDLIAATLSTKT